MVDVTVNVDKSNLIYDLEKFQQSFIDIKFGNCCLHHVNAIRRSMVGSYGYSYALKVTDVKTFMAVDGEEKNRKKQVNWELDRAQIAFCITEEEIKRIIARCVIVVQTDELRKKYDFSKFTFHIKKDNKTEEQSSVNVEDIEIKYNGEKFNASEIIKLYRYGRLFPLGGMKKIVVSGIIDYNTYQMVEGVKAADNVQYRNCLVGVKFSYDDYEEYNKFKKKAIYLRINGRGNRHPYEAFIDNINALIDIHKKYLSDKSIYILDDKINNKVVLLEANNTISHPLAVELNRLTSAKVDIHQTDHTTVSRDYCEIMISSDEKRETKDLIFMALNNLIKTYGMIRDIFIKAMDL